MDTVQDARSVVEGLQPAPVAFAPSPSEQWVLPNGLRVMYRYDPEIPVGRGGLYLRSGTLWMSDDEEGALSALGAQMRLGGAGELSADALDRRLEQLAASVSSSFGEEFGLLTFGSLDTDLEEVFGIFSDVLLRPRFEGDRLELWKRQALEGIRRRIDDPYTVANTAFGQLLYGDTPFGRVSDSEDVAKIDRELLLELHRKNVFPQGAILQISGKVSRATIEALVKDRLESWTAKTPVQQDLPTLQDDPKPQIVFISGDFSQSTIIMGQRGIKRLSPDHYAVEAFNNIFGTGGFGARLTQRVRTDRGLAYVVQGGVFAGPVRGRNVVLVQTKSESVGDALVESLAVLTELQTVPVPAAELDETLRAIQNSYVFRFDSPDDIVRREALLELLEYPDDYDTHYLERVGAITAADLEGVANRLWDPAKFTIVVVGNEAAFQDLRDSQSSLPEPLRSLPIKRMTFREKLDIK